MEDDKNNLLKDTVIGKNRKITEWGLSSLDRLKIPPQAVDIEEAVLGALMLEKNALTVVADIITKECFYKETHKEIFEAIQNLSNRSEPVDILTVCNELKKLGKLELVGGAHAVAQLTGRVASAANIEYHARIILQKYLQRELIQISSETLSQAFEETTDVFDLLDSTEQKLFKVSEGNIRKNYETMPGLLAKAVKKIEIASQNTSGITGVPAGFMELDKLTSGWQKSDLIILAARPAMGKTAFVLSIARNAAVLFRQPVAFFSLEMAAEQLVARLIAAETGISAEKLKKGNLEAHEWAQLHHKITALENAPIFIDDTAGISIFELRTKARRLKNERKIELIIVDYLQLMTAGPEHKGNREQEISAISRSLKAIAKELDIPIIALSQLSRSVETRGGSKKPMLSDLRESGAIEQDADMVMFIYRPEYYGLHEDESGMPTHGRADIIIAKHRSGAVGEVPLRFINEQAKFTDWNNGDFIDDGTYTYSTMPVGAEFDEQSSPIITRTLPSRVNDFTEEDPSDAPF
jgi:replicative DNA helicase